MRLTVACSKLSNGGDGAKKKVGRERTARKGEGGGESEIKTRTKTKHNGMAFKRYENNKNRSL